MSSHKDQDQGWDLNEQDPTWLAPAFWDNLHSIYLSSDALREAARRYYQPPVPKESHPEADKSVTDILATFTPQCLQDLRRFSRHGGPDLSDLTSCSFPEAYSGSREPPEYPEMMEAHGKITTYSPNFIRHLVAHDVYPAGHTLPDGRKTGSPANLKSIAQILPQSRPSSRSISEQEFQEFTEAYDKIMADQAGNNPRDRFTQLLEGTDINDSACKSGFVFKDLASLTDKSIGWAKPYRVAGARPEELDGEICSKLNEHIEPSNRHRLIAPNFFLEVKGAENYGSVTIKGRACYEGALGARAMHALRSYEQDPGSVDDHKAYTVTASLAHGVLELYVHHLTDGDTRKYMMTRLGRFDLLDSLELLQKGITAYRNARDWAKQQRDEVIMAANSRKPRLSDRLTSEPRVANDEQNAAPDGPEAENTQSPTAQIPRPEVATDEGSRGKKRQFAAASEVGSVKKARKE